MFIYVGRHKVPQRATGRDSSRLLPSLSLHPSLCLALPVSFWWGPINFIAHLIDRKNYSFISTKIAKSAQNQRNDAVGPLSVESE